MFRRLTPIFAALAFALAAVASPPPVHAHAPEVAVLSTDAASAVLAAPAHDLPALPDPLEALTSPDPVALLPRAPTILMRPWSYGFDTYDVKARAPEVRRGGLRDGEAARVPLPLEAQPRRLV